MTGQRPVNPAAAYNVFCVRKDLPRSVVFACVWGGGGARPRRKSPLPTRVCVWCLCVCAVALSRRSAIFAAWIVPAWMRGKQQLLLLLLLPPSYVGLPLCPL